MKILMRFLGLSCILLVAWTAASGGCSKRPPPIQDPTKAKSRDPIRGAVELMNNAATRSNFQDALTQFNSHLNEIDDPIPAITDAEKKVLADQFHLSKEELEFVGKSRFMPLDSAHLSMMFFLRDAAETLRVGELSNLDQARLVCEWVAQQVVLQEPAERWFPPRWTLLQGEGNTLERAMLMVHLLKQLQIESCALTAPMGSDDKPGPLLIGVFNDKKVYVFDPAMGVPVIGPAGNGVAQWKEIQAQPNLVAAYGIDAKQVGLMRPQLICSLPELAPRMSYLEETLADYEVSVSLAVKPVQLLQKWQTAAKSVTVWNPDDGGNSPLRSLRWFFPKNDEHAGIAEYQVREVPSDMFRLRLGELGLQNGLVEDERIDPKKRLAQFCHIFFVNYALAPRRLFFEGRFDLMNKRMTIIGDAISDVEFAPLPAAEMRRKIEEWKKGVNLAYIAWSKNPKEVQQVNAIWGEDLFLHGLLTSPEDTSFRKYKKKLLTYILMATVIPEIKRDNHWLSAQRWHTKAVVEDSIWRSKKRAKKPVGLDEFANQGKRTWNAAQRWWQKYLANYDLSVGAVHDRINHFSQDIRFGISQWDELTTDLTRAAHVKCLLADTFQRRGETDKALKHWQKAENEIRALLEDKELKESLNIFVTSVRKQTKSNPLLSTVLNRLTNLLHANGSLAQARKRAAFHLAK